MSDPKDTTSLRMTVTPGVVRGMIVRCLLALAILTLMAVAAYALNRTKARLLKEYVAMMQRGADESQLSDWKNTHDSLSATETSILLMTLFVIGVTGVGVFWPMIREVRLETERFAMANTILDQRAAELAATLRELEHERDERRSRMQEMGKVMEDLEEERGKLEREIQARQVVQDALEASEQRSFAIIESAPTAMVVTNGSGHVVMANAKAEELFGYDREQMLGGPIELLVPGRIHEQHWYYRSGYFDQPEKSRGESARDLVGLRKDGWEFPIEIGLSPIEMEEGRYVLSAIVDITQRKQAEEEIKRINKELQRRNDEMQQFVYTISHDLKSPLVTCKGFMGLMKEDALAGRWDVVLDSVGRIERAIQRMGDLIEDLLQLSRIGVIRNEPEEVNVTQMVRAIAEELGDRLQQAGANLEIQDNLPTVMADRIRLAEVFENLLSNAIKYGCRGGNGHIVVGGMHGQHEVCFFVRDNGPGIAREFHRKVFGLFQRLESNQEGTGVGLAAVARIMETHGGRAWVESAPGHGATFWIAFPAASSTVVRQFDLRSDESTNLPSAGTLAGRG